jgi:small subunit ribosomal protein S11
VRIGLRRNACFSLWKSAHRITKGVIHVQASFNNTIITVTYPHGQVVFWSCAGTCGFKKSRKASPYAGQRTVVDAICTVGLQRADIMVKGAGSERDVALRAIAKSGVRLSCIRDATPMPHNGCCPPTQRHL